VRNDGHLFLAFTNHEFDTWVVMIIHLQRDVQYGVIDDRFTHCLETWA